MFPSINLIVSKTNRTSATSWQRFMSAELEPDHSYESWGASGDAYFWFGSDGYYGNSQNTCNDWTSNSTTIQGGIGYTMRSSYDPVWMNYNQSSCDANRILLCACE